MLFNESPASSFSMSASRISLDLTPCLAAQRVICFSQPFDQPGIVRIQHLPGRGDSASLTVSILRWESRSKVLMVSISSPQNSIR